MDWSFSTSPPVPMNAQRTRSTPHFPLLDDRIEMFLKQILQKMKPETLATIRGSSSTVDLLLMEEATRREFYPHTTFEEYMRPDVVQNPEELPERSENWYTSAEVNLYEDSVHILRRPAAFSSTSLLFHQNHDDCSCSRHSYEFWKSHIQSISAGTAMSHLAGSIISCAEARNISDATSTIALVRPYNIRAGMLFLRNCSPEAASQLLSHFQSTTLRIFTGDLQEDYQKSEQVAMDQIDADKLSIVCFDSTTNYPGRLIEHFWRRFLQGPTFLTNLGISYPAAQFPRENNILHSGMECCYLKNGDNQCILLRTRVAPARHVLLTGFITTSCSPEYRLVFQCSSDADELLALLFGRSYDPDTVDPDVSHFSPSQIREIFNKPY